MSFQDFKFYHTFELLYTMCLPWKLVKKPGIDGIFPWIGIPFPSSDATGWNSPVWHGGGQCITLKC